MLSQILLPEEIATQPDPDNIATEPQEDNQTTVPTSAPDTGINTTKQDEDGDRSATNGSMTPETIDSQEDEPLRSASPPNHKCANPKTHSLGARTHRLDKGKLAKLMGALGEASGMAMRQEIQRQIRTELGLRLKGPVPQNILNNDDGTIREICQKLGLSIARSKPAERSSPAIPTKPHYATLRETSTDSQPAPEPEMSKRKRTENTRPEPARTCEQCGQPRPQTSTHTEEQDNK